MELFLLASHILLGMRLVSTMEIRVGYMSTYSSSGYSSVAYQFTAGTVAMAIEDYQAQGKLSNITFRYNKGSFSSLKEIPLSYVTPLQRQ